MKTPEHFIGEIREAHGLDATDDFMDDEIENLTPREKLRMLTQWHLGDEAWADQVLEWATDLGMGINEGEDE